jgi:hypothetical protein
MWNLKSRTRVQVEENKYRVYPSDGPIGYKKSDGTFGEIDHTFNDTSSSIGDISLMDKGIVSVGKRKGNNPTKVVGIRPDNNQHLGTQQLEFSLINVELDGVSQSFDVETDLEIMLGPANVYQLVKVNKDFNDFKVEFDIYAKDLELQNSKYSSVTTIREDFDFNLTNLGEIEGGISNRTLNNIFTENRDTPFIDSCIFQITNNYITTGQYSNTEEFGDNDLSNYVIDNNLYGNGSSVYYKDCIIFLAKSYNIDENIEQIMVNKLCGLYGLENFDDGGIGQYLTKDNKKVIGYYTLDNVFYAFINTKAIPDDIKTLFQRKTFNDTSFLDITLSDFNTSITNKFNKFNDNLTITLDTDYYEPIHDRFVFKINKKSFYINLPVLIDENYNKLDLGTTHSLKQNSDGSYRYTKYFTMYGFLKNSHNIKYIDADLAVDSSYNRSNLYTHGTSTSVQRTQSNFDTQRNASTGTGFLGYNLQYQDLQMIMAGAASVKITPQSGSPTYSYTNYNSCILNFDTSGISGVVSSLVLKMTAKAFTTGVTGYTGNMNIIFVEFNSELDEATSDFNDFSGHTSDWDADDITEFSSAIAVTNTATGTELDFTLNSTAKSYMQNNSSMQIVPQEYDEWYSDNFNASINTSISAQRTFAANTTAASSNLRPFLEYEAGAASGYGHKVAGVAAASIGKVKGVATANIGKVIGVD